MAASGTGDRIMFELYVLLLFMIAGAIIAVELRDLLSAVIAMGAVGLSLSVAFLILKAPDLAITQLVVEILCLVILVRATINKDLPLTIEGRWVFNTIATLAFIGVFLFFAHLALKEIPSFENPIISV